MARSSSRASESHQKTQIFPVSSYISKSEGNFFELAMALAAVALCLAMTLAPIDLALTMNSVYAILFLTIALLANIAAVLFHGTDFSLLNRTPILKTFSRAPALYCFTPLLIQQSFVISSQYELPIKPLLFLPLLFGILIYSRENRRLKYLKPLTVAVSLLTFSAFAWWIVSYTPTPDIDVIHFQRDASQVLLSGKNPYDMTFPNIHKDDNSPFYGDGVSVNNVLQFGFPYPPFSLLWVMPFQALFDKVLYAHVIALAIAGAFMLAIRPSKKAIVVTFALLFCYPVLVVLRYGWTEPIAIMTLCALTWAMKKKIPSAAVAAGLLIATKQYLFLSIPLFLLLRSQVQPSLSFRKWSLIAGAVVALMTIPFFLWNASAFLHSAVLLHMRQPVRHDAVNYANFIRVITGFQLPVWLGFMTALGAILFCLYRAPRTIAGFCASLSLVLVVFFVFGKQAFINYYFLGYAAMCCAVVASGKDDNETASLSLNA